LVVSRCNVGHQSRVKWHRRVKRSWQQFITIDSVFGRSGVNIRGNGDADSRHPSVSVAEFFNSVIGRKQTMLSNASELVSQQAAGLLPLPAIELPDLRDSQPRLRARGGLPPRALRRVREYIEANLEETVSVQTLADIAGLSMYHFARAFKQSEGVTPHDYLVQCRVRHAQDLLASTDLPLSEIAVAAGFADQSHCARRFREHVGLSPSSYRWSMR
jgi:AraC-like DNA-binding protein